MFFVIAGPVIVIAEPVIVIAGLDPAISHAFSTERYGLHGSRSSCFYLHNNIAPD